MRVAVGALVSIVLASCGGVTDEPTLTTKRQAIINGTPSAADQNYVVQISMESTSGTGNYLHLCTGTLIAKNIILTARHCVGEPSADDLSVTDYAPNKLFFYFGQDGSKKVNDKAPAEARGAKLFTNGKTSLSPDIALVLLDREIEEAVAPIASIRLEGGAVKGEKLDIVGFGVTEQNQYPARRYERKGVTVAAKGPGRTAGSLFDLEKGEFQFGEAACVGDSGGPALAAGTNAVVGVASRVSNGKKKNESFPNETCMGPETEDVYVDLTVARAFIDAAFAEAGQEPWIEGEPSPAEKAAAAAAEEEQKRKAAAATTGEDPACSIAHRRTPSRAPVMLFAFTAFAVSLLLLRRRPY